MCLTPDKRVDQGVGQVRKRGQLSVTHECKAKGRKKCMDAVDHCER